MFTASDGDGVAARAPLYRHPLVRLLTPLLPPLGGGYGWSAVALALASVLMSWDAAPTLAQRFEGALAVLDAALPRRRRTGRTYQGFVKALARRGAGLLVALAAHLRVLTRQAAGRNWTVGEFIPIGVDGSRFDAPRTIGNEALGLAGKDKCGPQMMTLLLVHLGSMLPWSWKVGGARDSERSLLRGLLGQLPKGTLLVADAGFVGFDFLNELGGRGLSFLIRVGRGVRLLTELGYYRREGRNTVYLWPDTHRRHAPLVLRLIRVGDMCLITNVTDAKRLSKKTASELYRRRWGLEVAFRTLKQTLERRRVRSGTARNARAELSWALVGLWILALLGVRALRTVGHGPRRLSLAAVLAAVRAARLRPVPDRVLKGRLRRAVLDPYQRLGRKKAYRGAHKKRPPPPGPPKITTATAEQIRLARAFRGDRRAA